MATAPIDVAVRTTGLADLQKLEKRMDALQKEVDQLTKKLPKAKGFKSILYPGERKNNTYRKNLNKDISIPPKILKELNDLHDK